MRRFNKWPVGGAERAVWADHGGFCDETRRGVSKIRVDKHGDWDYGTELPWVRQPLWSGSHLADRCERFRVKNWRGHSNWIIFWMDIGMEGGLSFSLIWGSSVSLNFLNRFVILTIKVRENPKGSRLHSWQKTSFCRTRWQRTDDRGRGTWSKDTGVRCQTTGSGLHISQTVVYDSLLFKNFWRKLLRIFWLRMLGFWNAVEQWNWKLKKNYKSGL